MCATGIEAAGLGQKELQESKKMGARPLISGKVIREYVDQKFSRNAKLNKINLSLKDIL